MAGLALVLLVTGRSETIRGLRGDGRDERFAQIDLRATAVTGLVLLVTLIVAWLVQIARGHSGHLYDWRPVVSPASSPSWSSGGAARACANRAAAVGARP